MQATCRSLIVDTLPESQQQLGSAWGQSDFASSSRYFTNDRIAGGMLGLGHVLGYLVGTVNLSNYLGTSLGATQFKQVCVIAGSIMVFCASVTCFCVKEYALVSQRSARRII